MNEWMNVVLESRGEAEDVDLEFHSKNLTEWIVGRCFCVHGLQAEVILGNPKRRDEGQGGMAKYQELCETRLEGNRIPLIIA